MMAFRHLPTEKPAGFLAFHFLPEDSPADSPAFPAFRFLLDNLADLPALLAFRFLPDSLAGLPAFLAFRFLPDSLAGFPAFRLLQDNIRSSAAFLYQKPADLAAAVRSADRSSDPDISALPADT